MPDRKITELAAADPSDLSEDTAILHLVNPTRSPDSTKNRAMTRVQLPYFIPSESITSEHLGPGSVTREKLADSADPIPAMFLLMGA